MVENSEMRKFLSFLLLEIGLSNHKNNVYMHIYPPENITSPRFRAFGFWPNEFPPQEYVGQKRPTSGEKHLS